MKQTRQAVHAIQQSILLSCLWVDYIEPRRSLIKQAKWSGNKGGGRGSQNRSLEQLDQVVKEMEMVD
jgi:hypothetical protein